ncbi:hypothetical protein BHM03_00029513 [Ensete ventricosum]|nr:hypothetical protein BHM03_00029513 [Ensete ventricosum]
MDLPTDSSWGKGIVLLWSSSTAPISGAAAAGRRIRRWRGSEATERGAIWGLRKGQRVGWGRGEAESEGGGKEKIAIFFCRVEKFLEGDKNRASFGCDGTSCLGYDMPPYFDSLRHFCKVLYYKLDPLEDQSAPLQFQVLVQLHWGALIDRLSRDNVTLQAQVRRPKEEKNVTEARAAKLSSQLSQACLRAEEPEQHLIEVCNEADSQVDELNMEHSLALHHAKEADAQVEEACDEEAIDEGIIGKPIVGASNAQWKSK